MVERHEDHSLKEMWVYTGTGASGDAADRIHRMLREFSLLTNNHERHVAAQTQFAKEMKP